MSKLVAKSSYTTAKKFLNFGMMGEDNSSHHTIPCHTWRDPNLAIEGIKCIGFLAYVPVEFSIFLHEGRRQ